MSFEGACAGGTIPFGLREGRRTRVPRVAQRRTGKPGCPFLFPGHSPPARGDFRLASGPEDLADLSSIGNDSTSGISGSDASGAVFVQLRVATTTEPAMFLFIGPPGPNGASFTSPGIGNQAIGSTEMAKLPVPTQPVQATPFLATAGANAPGSYSTIPGTGSNGSLAGVIAVGSTGVGRMTAANPAPGQLPSIASAPGGQNSPIIADLKRVDIAATLDPEQPVMTLQIPVGPMTGSLGLSLRDTGGTSGDFAEFGQIDLVNSTGTMVEQSIPSPVTAAGMLQG